MFYFLPANILCDWAKKNSTELKAPLWTYLELFVGRTSVSVECYIEVSETQQVKPLYSG